MTNALIAEFALAVLKKRKPTAAHLAKAAIVAAVIITTITYGKWRITQSERFVKPGPMVGSVQSNIPQSVKSTGEASDVIFDKLLDHSSQAAAAGAQLIIWPETMVQAILNERVWPHIYAGEEYKDYHQKIAQHAKDKAFILVGAYGGDVTIQENGQLHIPRYNSAFMYRPDGTKDEKWYSKIHLVLFGEVVPFYRTFPALYRLLMKFVPENYQYNYSLEPGTEYTVFEIADDPNQPVETYRFGVLICYEDTIPKIAREFAKPENGKKNVDFLVNISNDGWFVRFTDGKTIPTTELPQHTAVCTFRAIENRLAVVRSVNTGISCIIDSLGRVTDGYTAGDLPQNALQRTGMAGWFVDRLPIDKRITVFSRYGQWLDYCCAAGLIAFMVLPLIKRRLKRKTRSGKVGRKSR
jgi:apolipoprotein N-acyltransferase